MKEAEDSKLTPEFWSDWVTPWDMLSLRDFDTEDANVAHWCEFGVQRRGWGWRYYLKTRDCIESPKHTETTKIWEMIPRELQNRVRKKWRSQERNLRSGWGYSMNIGKSWWLRWQVRSASRERGKNVSQVMPRVTKGVKRESLVLVIRR